MKKQSKRQQKKKRNPRQTESSSAIDLLIDNHEPAFEAFHIPEPKLVFGEGRGCVDPKAGIELYGPFDLDRAKKQIRIGVIGTGDCIQGTVNLLHKCQTRIAPGLNSRGKPFDPICFPHFPGNSLSNGFRCEFMTSVAMHRILRDTDVQVAIQKGDHRDKLKALVQLIVNECVALSVLEEAPHVVIVALPESLKKDFGPSGSLSREQIKLTDTEKLKQKLQKTAERTGQGVLPLIFEDEEAATGPDGFWNLHHSLKAQCMQFDFPIQMIWESTLTGDGLSQDPASVAWNLTSALYYKAGNVPWQILSMPDNTCFVGISFYKESPLANADMQTSLAQIFGAGDGLVLQGQKAVVDKKRDRRPHLTEDAAQDLLRRAIELYTSVNKQPPRRVVIHKTSKFWPEEQSGFRKALGNIYFYDFVAIDDYSSVRFMRVGHKPPLRGTAIVLEPRHYLLYTVGYIPYFKEYPGMRIPRPIEIMEHIGDSSALDICREILALTKLNWNSCAFANSQPITISFARSVGRILTEFQTGGSIKTRYRYYM
jgi:hypothetical protein